MAKVEGRYANRGQQPDSHSRKPVRQINTARFLAVVALLFALVAGWQTYREFGLAQNGVEASGTVVDRFHSNKTEYATVTFTTAAGRKARADIRSGDWGGSGVPKVGAAVRIRYNPSDPDHAIDARQGTASQAVFPAFLWMGVVIFGFWAFRKRRAARR